MLLLINLLFNSNLCISHFNGVLAHMHQTSMWFIVIALHLFSPHHILLLIAVSNISNYFSQIIDPIRINLDGVSLWWPTALYDVRFFRKFNMAVRPNVIYDWLNLLGMFLTEHWIICGSIDQKSKMTDTNLRFQPTGEIFFNSSSLKILKCLNANFPQMCLMWFYYKCLFCVNRISSCLP